jgi:hypothetical protein
MPTWESPIDSINPHPALEQDRQSAETYNYETEHNVLKTAGTVLGIGVVKQLLSKARGALGGTLNGGINPHAGVDVPNVETPPSGRPSPRQAEIDAANRAGPDYAEQQSFKSGEPARFGEPGSVRPDAFNCKTCTSLEVKAFDLNRPGGISSLTSNIAKQAKDRVDNLPPEAVQKIVVDARGQVITEAIEIRIKADIIRKSGGIIKAENIRINR